MLVMGCGMGASVGYQRKVGDSAEWVAQGLGVASARQTVEAVCVMQLKMDEVRETWSLKIQLSQ